MLNSEGKDVCWICGALHEYENMDNPDLSLHKCVTKHTDWCDKIGGNIDYRFKKTYAEVYNVLEIALDGDKLKKVKDLIGDAIYDTKVDCFRHVRNYLLNKPS